MHSRVLLRACKHSPFGTVSSPRNFHTLGILSLKHFPHKVLPHETHHPRGNSSASTTSFFSSCIASLSSLPFAPVSFPSSSRSFHPSTRVTFLKPQTNPSVHKQPLNSLLPLLPSLLLLILHIYSLLFFILHYPFLPSFSLSSPIFPTLSLRPSYPFPPLYPPPPSSPTFSPLCSSSPFPLLSLLFVLLIHFPLSLPLLNFLLLFLLFVYSSSSSFLSISHSSLFSISPFSFSSSPTLSPLHPTYPFPPLSPSPPAPFS